MISLAWIRSIGHFAYQNASLNAGQAAAAVYIGVIDKLIFAFGVNASANIDITTS